MIKLAIRTDNVTHYFNPQKDYDIICDFLIEQLGWSYEAAEEVASWAEDSYYEEEYETGDLDVEIFFVEQ